VLHAQEGNEQNSCYIQQGFVITFVPCVDAPLQPTADEDDWRLDMMHMKSVVNVSFVGRGGTKFAHPRG
jgi:hypothetical protein